MNASTFKKLRKRIGTQAEVARLIGVHQVSVSKWESGATIPADRADGIERLAADPEAARARLGASVKAGPDPISAVDITEAADGRYSVTITRHSGATRIVTTPTQPTVRLSGDVVELVPTPPREAKIVLDNIRRAPYRHIQT